MAFFMAANIFDGERELVCSGFGTLVTDAERRGALRDYKGESLGENPVECPKDIQTTARAIGRGGVTDRCNFNIH